MGMNLGKPFRILIFLYLGLVVWPIDSIRPENQFTKPMPSEVRRPIVLQPILPLSNKILARNQRSLERKIEHILTLLEKDKQIKDKIAIFGKHPRKRKPRVSLHELVYLLLVSLMH